MGPIQHEYRERYGDEEMGISCYQDQSIRSIEQFARFAIMVTFVFERCVVDQRYFSYTQVLAKLCTRASR